MKIFPIILLMIAGLVVIIRPLTVLLHELGHAIPAILLTKEKVTIYIGSYQNPDKSLKLRLGRLLEIFFRYNPFAWRLGLCIPSAKEISINKQIVYTLTGPITSFILGGIACYITFSYDLHGFLKFFLIIFLALAIIDLLGNLIPDQNPIELPDGTVIFNDGYALKYLFKLKKLDNLYLNAVDMYNNQQYADSATKFEQVLAHVETEEIFRLTIASYLIEKNYLKAKEISDAFASKVEFNSDDFSNMALAYAQLGFFEQSIEYYNKSLELNPENIYSLNNKAYTLILLERYPESIELCNLAIASDASFAYSYNNRGFAKIKLGLIEEGLKEIRHSITLNPDNSYCYKNLGIYYFDQGEFDEALSYFNKAKELDETTYMVKEWIDKVLGEIKKIKQSDMGVP